MFFCTFQEVMFVSSKYAIFAFPGPIVSTPFRIFQSNSPNPNQLRGWPGTRPRGFDGLWTAFVLAVACLMVAVSGCGSGVIVSASEALVRVTPGTVDFGNVGVGVSAASNVTVTNHYLTDRLA
jgi:hypothetical protein